VTQSEQAWLILGGSSAVARAFARVAAADGADILLAGRDIEDLERTAADLRVRHGRRAEALQFDATAYEEHAAFVEAARGRAKRLDVFLAFGLMPTQAAIESEPALARRTIEANTLGAVSILLSLLPALEAQGQGRVVVMSSVAGDRGRLKNYVYGSAKAGVTVFTQGFRARMFRAGVAVTTVKAGFIDTAMTFGLPGLFLVATPEACARACLRFAKRGKESAYYPAFWRLIMAIIKAIPEPIFKRLSI
jgi:NAD(P)-dependent dehydrogenase (short-subunit alcohol dehydrogenase family)